MSFVAKIGGGSESQRKAKIKIQVESIEKPKVKKAKVEKAEFEKPYVKKTDEKAQAKNAGAVSGGEKEKSKGKDRRTLCKRVGTDGHKRMHQCVEHLQLVKMREKGDTANICRMFIRDRQEYYGEQKAKTAQKAKTERKQKEEEKEKRMATKVQGEELEPETAMKSEFEDYFWNVKVVGCGCKFIFCFQCGQLLSRDSDKSRHVWSHKDYKPFECPLPTCILQAGQRHNIEIHLMKVHNAFTIKEETFIKTQMDKGQMRNHCLKLINQRMETAMALLEKRLEESEEKKNSGDSAAEGTVAQGTAAQGTAAQGMAQGMADGLAGGQEEASSIPPCPCCNQINRAVLKAIPVQKEALDLTTKPPK